MKNLFKLLLFFLILPAKTFAADITFGGWETSTSGGECANGVVGTSTIQTSNVRTGVYSLLTNPATTATGYCEVEGYTTAGVATNPNVVDEYCRVYMRITTLPSSNEPIFTQRDTTNAATKGSIQLTSGGKLAMYDAAGLIVGSAGSTTLSTGTWYRIETHFGTGVSTTEEVKIDGAVELTSATANLGAANNGRFNIGKYVNVNGSGYSINFDDFRCSDSAYPGDGQTVRLIPTSNGTTMAWTSGTNASDWNEVKEATADGATTVVQNPAATTNETALFNVTASANTATAITGTINNFKLGWRIAETSGTNVTASKGRISSSGVTSDSATRDGSTSYTTLFMLQATDPNTGAAWTTGGIDSVQLGVVETLQFSDRLTKIDGYVDFTTTTTTTTTSTSTSTSTSTTTTLATKNLAALGVG